MIIRHAKSSWDKAILHDKDRPLNERGKHDAPEMARRLLKARIPIDLFISSPAKRARKTAELFIREYGGKEEEILLIPELYHPEPFTFNEVIGKLDNTCKSVAIFSHNPGITAFINTLGILQLDNMPTCGVLVLRCHTHDWNGFSQAKKELLLFDYPGAAGE